MIVLENVVKAYPNGVGAINGISLHIERGEFVFVVGDSGSGKSTLIKLLLKELEPTRRNDPCKWRESWTYEKARDPQVPQKDRMCIPGFPSSERQKCI